MNKSFTFIIAFLSCFMVTPSALASFTSKVIVEYSVGPSYWVDTKTTSTFIEQTHGVSKEIDFRVVLRESDGSTKLKFISTSEAEKIKQLIRKMNRSRSWKDFNNSMICDGATIEINAGRKRTATYSTSCGGGKHLPPTTQYNALRTKLSMLTSQARQQPDAVIPASLEAKLTIAQHYELWLDDVWRKGDQIETQDLVLTDWGYSGSSSRLEKFLTYLEAEDYLYSVYEVWLEDVYPKITIPESLDLVSTNWGYSGSSSRLNSFLEYIGKRRQ